MHYLRLCFKSAGFEKCSYGELYQKQKLESIMAISNFLVLQNW